MPARGAAAASASPIRPQTGCAIDTCATQPVPKKLFSRAKVRSMNWSMTTKSPGARSSRRLPTADKRDDVGHAAALQRVDIGAEIDLGGRQHVPAAVPRHEHDRLAVERAEAEFVGGRAERALDPAPLDIRQAVDLIEPAAADNADDRRLAIAQPSVGGRPDLALGGVKDPAAMTRNSITLNPVRWRCSRLGSAAQVRKRRRHRAPFAAPSRACRRQTSPRPSLSGGGIAI